MRSIIRTEHLDSGYGHKVIVAGAEITVQAGEIVTLIGPNGAGKSTVLKTIAGQLEPVAGTIYIGDEERSSYSLSDIAKKQTNARLEKEFSISAHLRTRDITTGL